MFAWFTSLMQFFGLASAKLDEVNTTLDKATEPLEKAGELRGKIEGLGDKAESAGRAYRDIVR